VKSSQEWADRESCEVINKLSTSYQQVINNFPTGVLHRNERGFGDGKHELSTKIASPITIKLYINRITYDNNYLRTKKGRYLFVGKK